MSTQAERLITASKIIPLKYMTYKHTINNYYGESSIKSRRILFLMLLLMVMFYQDQERSRLLVLILTSKIPVPNCWWRYIYGLTLTPILEMENAPSYVIYIMIYRTTDK